MLLGVAFGVQLDFVAVVLLEEQHDLAGAAVEVLVQLLLQDFLSLFFFFLSPSGVAV